MSIRKIITLLCVLGAGLIANETKAGTTTCHSCTDLQMESIAWDKIGELKMYGPLYIFDMDRGVVKKYVYRDNMTPEFNPEFDAFEAWVESWPVEQDVQNLSSQLHNAVVSANGNETLYIPVGNGLPEDAYAAIRNPSQDHGLTNYISDQPAGGIIRRVLDVLQIADIPFINEDRLRYPQPVEYQSDGSKAIYVYNEATNRWERVPGSSRDRNGNIIPEAPEDVDGGGTRDYTFGDLSDDQNWNAINDFWDYLQQSGIPVVDATQYSVQRSGSYGMTCTETHCTIWYIY